MTRIKVENEFEILARAKKVSHIDGEGLWNSFTRSFSSPLMACFDLIDNVFDASHLRGTLRIGLDARLDEYEGYDAELELEANNGFYMINNCDEKVKSMKEILTVFNSQKVNKRCQIGENGVGVKQGCATLSDISFVMSRNKDIFSLGILAKKLQKKTGIYLPSFEFEFDREVTHMDLHSFLSNEVSSICTLNADIAEVLVQYGFGSLPKGIYRLVQNLSRLSTKAWKEEESVFCLCIHDLKHGEAGYFLRQLTQNLPKHYLHVPCDFEVFVDEVRVNFSHWSQRLANLTRFTVRIPKDRCIDTENVNGYDEDSDGDEIGDHSLNVYLGFDAIRCKDKNAPTHASIYYYSRLFGRLIKYHQDARGILGLLSSGSHFSQGLTIIVDDRGGGLPLNPTKQDFAFGEHEHGEKWQHNLTLLISAVTKLYYDYHLENLSRGKKTTLTQMVTKLADEAKKKRDKLTHASSNCYFKSIGQLETSIFEGIKWKYNSQHQNVAVVARKDIKPVEGKDADLILKRRNVVKKKTQQGKKSPAKISPSKSSPTQTLNENETLASSRRTSSRLAAISNSSKKRYNEDDESEETEEFDSIRNVSKSTTAKRKKLNDGAKIELTNVQKRLEDKEKELEDKEKELEDAKLDVEVLEKQLTEKEMEISRLTRLNTKLERELERCRV